MTSKLMSVTAPPPVYGYAELQLAMESLKDSIIAAVDIENIDHTRYGNPGSPREAERSYWHINTGKPHVADPYHCRYAASRRTPTGKTGMEQISNFVGTFPKWNHHKPSRATQNPGPAVVGSSEASQVTSLLNNLNLDDTYAGNNSDDDSQRASSPESASTDTLDTDPSSATSNAWEAIRSNASDVAQSKSRHAMVMFWDAHLERTTFNATENKKFDKPDTTFLDLQKWDLIRRRYKDQPSCSTLLHSLGIEVPNLHNACNDVVAEVLAFIRILKFTEEEYNAWTGKQNLPTIRANIQNAEAYRANRKMEKQMEGRQEARRRNKTKGKKNGKNNRQGPVPG
ncbi:hypothetical protein QBC37DRAFT_465308 [Rhypophila decipiens]|uniref:Uncharacterized protein n=1 Tax=Rhypophila decipiens TaxID=261697 RepID=A0AAN6Y7A4_9PEZI|nr:hypothetical protein QBC37DRAFT_465308 [Rhypophila decipiens]